MAVLDDYKRIRNRKINTIDGEVSLNPTTYALPGFKPSTNASNTNTSTTQVQPTTTSTPTTSTPSKWEEYQSAIKSYEANAQADLASIQQQTNKYMQNYLAQYGLAGSGAGQTAMVQNANNMANINQDMLRQNQASSMAYRQGLQEDAMNQIQKRIESGAYDSIQLQDYINQMAQDNGLDASTIQNMRDEVDMAGIDWVKERDNYIKKIDEAMAQTGDTTSRAELQALRDQLNNGKLTQEEFNDIVSNNELLNSNIGMAEQLAQNESQRKKQIEEELAKNIEDEDELNDIKKAIQTGKKIDANDDPIAVDKELDFNGSGDPSDDQNKYVTAIMNAVKEGKLANGQFVNLNYGFNWDTKKGLYVVYDGALYKVKTSINAYAKYGNKLTDKILDSDNMKKFGISI